MKAIMEVSESEIRSVLAAHLKSKGVDVDAIAFVVAHGQHDEEYVTARVSVFVGNKNAG